MLAARRLTLASRLSAAVAPRVASRVAGSASSLSAAATRAFATASRRKRSASAKPAKRTRSRSVKRAASKGRRAAPRNVSPAVARKRAAAARRREAEEDKASRAKARKAEQKERAAAKEQDKKEAKAERKAALRERKQQREEEAKAQRAISRENKREQRAARREREAEHARDVRDRKKFRQIVKKDRENEELAFKKLRQKAVAAGDPNAPKRALSAWTLFAKEKLAGALAKAEGTQKAKASVAMKALSAEWKALPAEAKKPYEDKAAADKARYASESASYEASIPKPPQSAYMLWANANRAAIEAAIPADVKGKARLTAFGKAAGEQWKSVSADAKAQFQSQYAEAKSKFESVKAKFVNEQLAQLPTDLQQIMRTHIPGRVNEIPAWVGKVQQLLQQEMANDAKQSGGKKKASA